MDPSSFYGKRRGSQDDENGTDGLNSEYYADFWYSDSSPTYASSNSKISCDDYPYDNEVSEDDASSAYDNPSNEWNPTVATTRSFFTGSEHLAVQLIHSEADGIVTPFDV